MNKDLIREYLNATFLVEETEAPSLKSVKAIQKDDEDINKEAMKDVEKKMEEYLGGITGEKENEEVVKKYNLNDEQKAAHERGELPAGSLGVMEVEGDTEEWDKRQKEAIEGSQRMGNKNESDKDGEVANVVPGDQAGFKGPQVNKDIYDNNQNFKKQSKDAKAAIDARLGIATDADTNDALLGEKKKVNEGVNEDLTKQVSTGSGWGGDEKYVHQGNLTLNSYAKKLYSLFKKDGAKVLISSTGFKHAGDLEGNQVGIDTASTQGKGIRITISIGQNSMQMANKYGPLILKTFPDLEVIEKPKEINDWEGVSAVEFVLTPKKDANLTENKKNVGMKRLVFKNEFKGVENALKLIPESYKVNNKTFQMTDGNENYEIRWEGDINEGRAIILKASDKQLMNEDMQKMKHLMTYKSQDTLGTLNN